MSYINEFVILTLSEVKRKDLLFLPQEPTIFRCVNELLSRTY